jgi:hypothetical protein
LSFDVSENQKMIAQMVRDFGEKGDQTTHDEVG